MDIMIYDGPRKLRVESIPELPILPGTIRTRALCSGISHGTEQGVYQGTAPFFRRKMDGSTRLFVDANEEEVWTYPVRSCDPGVWYMGYAHVGEVIEVASDVTDFKLGDIVYASAPHQSQCILPQEAAVKLPDGINPEYGVFFTNLVTVLNGILDTRIKVGDTIVISGLGVLGQLAAQLAKLNGASQVIGIDPIEQRRKIAKENGIDKTFDPTEGDVAMEIRKLTNMRGPDAVIEVSGSVKALNEAIRIAAPDTTVTAMGWYQGMCGELNLSEEFHHNRITLRCSQTGSTDPSIQNLWDYKRREETCLSLLSTLRFDNLITQRVDFKDVASAYERIEKNPSEVIQIALVY